MAKLSKQEYAKQKRAEQRELLEKAVSKLMTSEGWRQYLETRARFYKYSFFNTILINLQKPEATKVGGAKSVWAKEFDRRILKGEKAIKILAPMFVYVKDANGNPVVVDGKKQVDHVWYKTVNVFDVSQTEGEELPKLPIEPISGESHEEYVYRAEQFAKGNDITVKFAYVSAPDEDPNRFGQWVPSTSELIVNDCVPVNTQVRSIIQGLARALFSDIKGIFEYTPEQRNVIAESAAYLVCQSINLDTAGMSVPFIASFAEGNAIKLMKEFASKVDELATKIEEGIS